MRETRLYQKVVFINFPDQITFKGGVRKSAASLFVWHKMGKSMNNKNQKNTKAENINSDRTVIFYRCGAPNFSACVRDYKIIQRFLKRSPKNLYDMSGDSNNETSSNFEVCFEATVEALLEKDQIC